MVAKGAALEVVTLSPHAFIPEILRPQALAVSAFYILVKNHKFCLNVGFKINKSLGEHIGMMKGMWFQLETLSPRAFIASVLSPSALVARIISPTALRAEVLSPRALHTWILSPEALVCNFYYTIMS
ncbi:hypothetical protein KIN20_019136 [Parelaphostrongylus tenuis]|uniref:Uncharacterized protein n=1 Tax=Parelaphostrongylus tenuis TaxID=148309 RepID=A0AAD5N530_PARTN|nr:hypothetical protein KIN20_019136 [Parelaphostrongylus tenuis]